MSIDEADPRLTAYVFGELSSEDQAALEAELASDESARARLAEIRRTIDALRGELIVPKPPLLEAERRQKIEALAGAARSQKRRRLLWGATVRARLGRQTLREDIDLQDRTLIALVLVSVLITGLFGYQ